MAQSEKRDSQSDLTVQRPVCHVGGGVPGGDSAGSRTSDLGTADPGGRFYSVSPAVMVAVEGGKSTPSGELFNDIPDRVVDPLILVAA